MNLIIDIGNSKVKLFIFHNGEPVWQYAGSKKSADGLQETVVQGKIERAIVSAVAEPGKEFLEAMKQLECPLLKLSSETPVPIRNGYASPKTLGTDRLAAVVGANVLFPKNDVLVIDAGTCITYDVIDHSGVYIGGNIAPGKRIRFSSMHTETERLPLVSDNGVWPKCLGRTTEEALRGGVMWGLKAEVDYYIESLKVVMPQLKVILTGGDAPFLKEIINKDDLMVDPLLVAKGLNRILDYNEN